MNASTVSTRRTGEGRCLYKAKVAGYLADCLRTTFACEQSISMTSMIGTRMNVRMEGVRQVGGIGSGCFSARAIGCFTARVTRNRSQSSRQSPQVFMATHYKRLRLRSSSDLLRRRVIACALPTTPGAKTMLEAGPWEGCRERVSTGAQHTMSRHTPSGSRQVVGGSGDDVGDACRAGARRLPW